MAVTRKEAGSAIKERGGLGNKMAAGQKQHGEQLGTEDAALEQGSVI